MGTTPILNLPYPDPTSSVDVPRDVRALAEAIDALRGQGYFPYTAHKTADTPFSGTSPIEDPQLGFTGIPAGTYAMDGFFGCLSETALDLSIGFNFNNGRLDWGLIGAHWSNTTPDGAAYAAYRRGNLSPVSSGLWVGGAGSAFNNANLAIVRGTVEFSSTGRIFATASQVSTGAGGPSYLLHGSHLRLQRMV